MIDAHTHLYAEKYDRDLKQVIGRARKVLDGVIISAVDADSLERSLAIRRQHPDFVFVSAGIHPRQAAGLTLEERRSLWQIVDQQRHEIVAVGEVGPDFHHVRQRQKQQRQLQVLEEALKQAESWNLPLVVHARQAENAALEVLASSRVPVVFHCFNASRPIARQVAERGFYLSFSALLLFAPALGPAAAEAPPEQILVETDSPALSPRPEIRRNEPAFVKAIVTHLAQLRRWTVEQAAQITAANARRFYRLPNPPGA